MIREKHPPEFDLNILIDALDEAYRMRVHFLFSRWSEADLQAMSEAELSRALQEIEKVIFKLLDMEKKIGARKPDEELCQETDLQEASQTILDRISRQFPSN